MVEGLHAVVLGAFHQFTSLKQLVFEHVVLHRGSVDQQVDDGISAFAAFFQHQTLADNGHQVQCQVHQNLRMPLFRIQVHNTLNGLAGVGGVDGEET